MSVFSNGFNRVRLSEEEVKRRKQVAITYSKNKFEYHVRLQKIERLRWVLMNSAIKALPTEALQKEAKTPDYTPFPLFRHPAWWTPPDEAREGGRIK